MEQKPSSEVFTGGIRLIGMTANTISYWLPLDDHREGECIWVSLENLNKDGITLGIKYKHDSDGRSVVASVSQDSVYADLLHSGDTITLVYMQSGIVRRMAKTFTLPRWSNVAFKLLDEAAAEHLLDGRSTVEHSLGIIRRP